jgi:hypothetical protein
MHPPPGVPPHRGKKYCNDLQFFFDSMATCGFIPVRNANDANCTACAQCLPDSPGLCNFPAEVCSNGFAGAHRCPIMATLFSWVMRVEAAPKMMMPSN